MAEDTDKKAPAEAEDIKKTTEKKSDDSKKAKTTGKVKNKIILDPEIEEEPGAPVTYDRNVNEALTALQRTHRAQVMRRIEPKLKRAKELAQSRLANDAKLKVRAQKAARNIIRDRLAGRQGISYADMDTATKIRLDKQLESKVGAIKRLAQRLFPKVRQAEQKRHHDFTHKDMTDHKAKTMAEAFDKTDGAANTDATSRYKKEVIVGKDGKRRVVTRSVKIRSIEERVEEGLQKKADSSGFDRETIDEVYARGIAGYNPDVTPTLTKEQYAFGRVNKFLADQSIDEDLTARFRRNIKRG